MAYDCPLNHVHNSDCPAYVNSIATGAAGDPNTPAVADSVANRHAAAYQHRVSSVRVAVDDPLSYGLTCVDCDISLLTISDAYWHSVNANGHTFRPRAFNKDGSGEHNPDSRPAGVEGTERASGERCDTVAHKYARSNGLACPDCYTIFHFRTRAYPTHNMSRRLD